MERLSCTFSALPEEIVAFAKACSREAIGRWWSFLDTWRDSLFLMPPAGGLRAFLSLLQEQADPAVQHLLEELVEGVDAGDLPVGGGMSPHPFSPELWERELRCEAGVFLGEAGESESTRLDHIQPFLRPGVIVRLLDPYFASRKEQKEAARLLLERCAQARVEKVEVWMRPTDRSPEPELRQDEACNAVGGELSRLLSIRCFKKPDRRLHDRVLQVGRAEQLDNARTTGPAFVMGRGTEVFRHGFTSYLARVPWRVAVRLFESASSSERPRSLHTGTA